MALKDRTKAADGLWAEKQESCSLIKPLQVIEMPLFVAKDLISVSVEKPAEL